MRGKSECENSQKKVSEKVWNRVELSVCQESAGLDERSKSGISFFVNRTEFLSDQSVAGAAKKMDKKSPNRKSGVELAEILLKKIH